MKLGIVQLVEVFRIQLVGEGEGVGLQSAMEGDMGKTILPL